MMPLLLGLLAGGAVLLLLGPGPHPNRPTPLARLYTKMGALPTPAAATPGGKPPWVRKLHLAPLVALIRPFFSSRYQAKNERYLRIARLDGYTPDDILAMKLTFLLACAFYAGLMFLKSRDGLLAGFLAGLGAMGFMYPDVWLAAKARRRQEQILRELPAFLSALAVALEAGLNLMGAVAEVTRDRRGALAGELRQAVDQYERGMPAAEALERVALRLEVPEFTVTLTGLIQAFAKGSGHVVSTVRSQASEAWQKRRRKAESLAQTASIKLFLPIALLALPGFLVFLLGPAVLEVMDYFLR